jgi:hypothetical protein
MTIGIVTTLRNTRLDAINTAINAGAGPGLLRVYSTPRPSTGGAVGAAVLLAELTFSDPAAAAAASGVLTFSAITADASANAGDPTNAVWCRIVDSTGAIVLDGDVGTSGADYNLNTISITAGVQVSCTSATLTEGNA